MAWENPTKVLSYPAVGDLSGFQYYAVALTTSATFPNGALTTISATTTKPIGVLQDAPDAAGVMAAVCVEGVSKMVVYAGTVNANDSVGVHASGYGEVTTTDNRWVVGDALESATDANNNLVLPVLVNVHRY
jgi:hypothetical protein